MAYVSVDVGNVIEQIRQIIVAVNDRQAEEKERTKASQLLVYQALSLHLALNYMRPPTGVLADVDWYTELRGPFTSGIFRKLGQNEHFKRAALLGDVGTRARIMMLLLWILAHRFPEDQVHKLVSTTVGDSLVANGLVDLSSEIAQLDSVKHVLVSLGKMFKTKLPLPPDRNPFMGPDYNPEDEDKPLPRSELWGYGLPEDQRYEYDAQRNPSFLLRRLEGKVIIPKTKLTLLLIQWASCNFGLGKKVRSLEEIDGTAFWNADPPSDDAISQISSESSSGDLVFDTWDGAFASPYEILFYDNPLDEWLHLRFCHVYKVHGWLHDSLTRILLFNGFCSEQRLPSTSDVLAAVHLSDRLRSILPKDIWQYAEHFIIARGFLLWQERSGVSPWAPEFAEWSPEQRGMTAIFADALRWHKSQPVVNLDIPQSFFDITEFLLHPKKVCQYAKDVLSLPRIAEEMPLAANRLPPPEPSNCTCGECILIHSRLPPSLGGFREHYFSIVSSRNCGALVSAWEPALRSAEEWLEGLVTRVESPFTLFVWAEENRTGPTVLEVANIMNFIVGSNLSDDQLLRFIVTLNSFTKDYPPAPPKPFGPLGLGYIMKMRWAADRDDYAVKGSPVDFVVYASPGWLYELVGPTGVTVLHTREDFSISYRTLVPTKFSAICMPDFTPDFLILRPSSHASGADEISQPNRRPWSSRDDGTVHISLIISSLKSDGFPLQSVADPQVPTPRGALAALIRSRCFGRKIETLWKPSVKIGSRCDHSRNWSRMTYCSPTAVDILLQVQPIGDDAHEVILPERQNLDIFRRPEKSDAECRQALQSLMMDNSRLVARLLQRGSPLERGRACIVRCGVNDGPVDPIIILAASLKKKVYIIHRQECWECALSHMQESRCSVGLAIDTKSLSVCDECRVVN